jgi:two-component system, cell cycle response regulator
LKRAQSTSGEKPTHVLIRMDGSEVGKVIRLNRERQFVIGRRNDCDLVLNYEGVSRQHARLVYAGGVFMVEDLGSANGTLVQGQSVSTHRLVDGDVIQLGPWVSIRYSITDSQEEQMLRQLYDAAVRDSLTGAYNREYLAERLRSEVAFSMRHGSSTALILFDIDHFKRVNDTYGHQAGDAVLVQLVERVQRSLRTEDMLARYGGEEFAVSMRGASVEGAARLAERIRTENHRAVRFGSHDIPMSVSIGCADLSDCELKTADGLIAVADRRLYGAKSGGRNRVVWTG